MWWEMMFCKVIIVGITTQLRFSMLLTNNRGSQLNSYYVENRNRGPFGQCYPFYTWNTYQIVASQFKLNVHTTIVCIKQQVVINLSC